MWLGGTIARSAVAYDVFQAGAQVELKQEFDERARYFSARNFSIMSVYTGTSYAAALIASVILAIMWRGRVKERGWLFMAFVLFFLAAPIVLIMNYYDLRLSLAIFWRGAESFDCPEVRAFFVERFTSPLLSMLHALSVLMNLTCVLYLVWRPLHIAKEN